MNDDSAGTACHGPGHDTLAEAGNADAEPQGGKMSKYRLVTRSDMDGLVAAMLLKQLEMIDEIVFVHPKDVQDGKVHIDGNDITANLPYMPAAHLAFDHHYSEMLRHSGNEAANYINIPTAPSAARIIYDYFGGKKRFTNISEEMMAEVDKADSAKFSQEEVLNESGWPLLSFIMDPRTGLGRFREFRISNYDLMMKLIDICLTQTIQQVLEDPDVRERVDLYMSHRDEAREQIERCSTVHGKLVVLDLRNEETIYCTNRFTIYALYPTCNISMHVLWGREKQNVVFAVGKSIFDRSSKIDVDALMLSYGGGGHEAAGTCQVPIDHAERVREELITKITRA
jgi:nanoRNase/pAp phosphatase (c-di-AMP/oligoRNAs hydrolase)